MNLKELVTKIQGTVIQKEALIKNYIGSNVEIQAFINNIESNELRVGCEGIDTDEVTVNIHYENEKFGTQLLSYSRYDGVAIIAKLSQASFSGYSARYQFELVSIRKTSTIAERIQQQKEDEAKGKTASGCFIATACYGNSDAPEVLVLRQYRDDKLLQTFTGQVFVKCYYSTSPFFATLISKSDWLKTSVRQYLLEPLVTQFQRRMKH